MRDKLSVVLATFNESENLSLCLDSIKNIADEIIIVDGGSNDNTVSIALSYGARVIQTDNPLNFHINKQKALDAAKFSWVLQLDADEIVTVNLGQEILKILTYTDKKRLDVANNFKNELFLRHQKLLESRDGYIGDNNLKVVAYFVPRKTFFLGGAIRYAGTYPDGVIRLVNKTHVFFPCKSVHEQIIVRGRVSWLQNDLLHYSNSSIQRYLRGFKNYTNLLSQQIKSKKNYKFEFMDYLIFIPLKTFLMYYFRHKGILDGWRGLLFSLFSSIHFPVAFLKALYD